MGVFSFIHAADLHIDSPLIGLGNYPGVPADQIRVATREAFCNLVQLAITQHVDFVLLVGDIYDGDWRDYNTGLFFVAELAKLREAGIPVVLLLGNHDAASQITKQLRLPDNVINLSHLKPETKRLDRLGVAVHGQSYATRDVLDNLVTGYPKALPDHFNIGLLHTGLTGSPDHAPYAPCTVEDLVVKNYDYWALGHVHARNCVSKKPWIVFPGNIQGRHIKETGPKGCTLVTVEDGEVQSVRFEAVDVARWAVCEISGEVLTRGTELIDRVASAIRTVVDQSEGRPLVVRIIVKGPCPAHADLSGDRDRWSNEVRAVATDVSKGMVWIEQVRLQTRTQLNLQALKDRNDAIGEIARLLETKDQTAVPAEFVIEAKEFIQKLPNELTEEDSVFQLDSPGTQAALLEEVCHLIVPLLLKRVGEE